MSALRLVRLTLAVATVGVGALALLGWHLGAPALVQVGAGRLPLSTSTAWAFVTAGIALATRTSGRARWVRVAALGTTLALVALQVVLLLEEPLPPPLLAPSPRVTIGLLLTVVSVVLTRGGGAPRLYAGLMGVLVAALGAVSVLGLGSSLRQLSEIGLNTAAGLCLLGSSSVATAWSALPEEAPPRVRARRLGLLVAGLATAVFCLLWQLLVIQERRRLLERVQATASHLAQDVPRALQEQVAIPLLRMGDRWELRRGTLRAEWIHEASQYLRDHPAVETIAVVDSDGEPRFCAPEGAAATLRLQALTPPGRAALQRAARTGQSQVSEGMPVEPGEPARFWVVVPVQGGTARMCLACVRYDRLLAAHLRPLTSLGWGVGVSAGGLLVAGEPPPPGAHGVQEDLVLGEPWVFEVWPPPALLEAWRSTLPELALLAGLALSTLVAALLKSALVARLHAAEIEAGNRRLAEEVRERLAAEQRLEHQAECLERAARELARSNRDLERFAAVAAHDLRAPLRGVRHLTRWLEEDLAGQLQGENLENLRLLRGRVDRMEELLDGLLASARSRRHHDRTPEPLDVRALLLEEWELLQAPPGFGLQLARDLPVLRTAKAPLAQVFRNLLANAVKHHDRPRGTVTVSVELDPGRGPARFCVRDDGPGIPLGQRERVFGMFQRGRDARSQGSGMGLALVQRLVEQAGGEVEVLPTDGPRGTAIRFSWPQAPPDQGANDTWPAAAVAS